MSHGNQDCVICHRDARGVATVTLNRARVHNAFNDQVIAALSAILDDLGRDERVRIVVLRGRGKSFSAGADAAWMRAAAEYDDDRNLADAVQLGDLLRRLNSMATPTLALVHGAALGGGLGLVACCDIVLAAAGARFGLTEVRLGLIPATISPYVIAAIGARAARRWFLTGERFDADTAAALGLVHEVVEDADALEAAGEVIIEALLAGAPGAIRDAKRLIFDVAGRTIDDALVRDTAARIAARRASAEGAAGLAAFLDKRKPRWPQER